MIGFLGDPSQFRLGDLPTEQPHPLTGRLSDLARENPAAALELLHRVDAGALECVLKHAPKARRLAERIRDTLGAGRRIHLCGCGATGRLSLVCEALWRRGSFPAYRERLRSFMAGGDAAMVRAAENFEDHPEYGARHLRDSGFDDGDLLIASTEGGETPYVIGATEAAADLSANPPCFLYCNPDSVLLRVAERSARVIANPRIEKFSLPVGPMALAGSTRLQATTALTAVLACAQESVFRPQTAEESLQSLVSVWKSVRPGFLADFICTEADQYEGGGRMEYESDAELAATVLTDIAERAPTFSLPPYDNAQAGSPSTSNCRLAIPGTADSAAAWEAMLGRAPRPLGWDWLGEAGSLGWLLGFDFSGGSRPPEFAAARRLSIRRAGNGIHFRLDAHSRDLELEPVPDWMRQLVLKMLLNMHSTLVMGRLGRYEGNLMTWVKPANNKLCDRAIRYADALLRRRGIRCDYRRIGETLFRLMPETPPDGSVVHALVSRLANECAAP